MDLKYFFLSLASGSSGNCSYIGCREEGVLIDAGISLRRLRQCMAANAIPLHAVKAIIVSHEHGDHVRHLWRCRAALGVPVYIHAKALKGMSGLMPDHLETVTHIAPHKSFFVAGLEITPFPVPHDAACPMGFAVDTPVCRLAYASDLGEVSDVVRYYAQGARLIHLEFNYDPQMLLTGPYPWYLKNRIKSRTGHLSNQAAADFVHHLCQQQLELLSIAHVSQKNNRLELAIKEATKHLPSTRVFETYHHQYGQKIYV